MKRIAVTAAVSGVILVGSMVGAAGFALGQPRLSDPAHATGLSPSDEKNQAALAQESLHGSLTPSPKPSPGLKGCERHAAAINAKMKRIVARGQRQLTVFDSVAQRTEDFADSHTKPSDYDQLVAGVNAQRQAAEDGLTALKSKDGFTCTAGDPKALADAFKASLASEITLLKAYKTSIVKLIVGVKSAQSQAKTATPEVTQ